MTAKTAVKIEDLLKKYNFTDSDSCKAVKIASEPGRLSHLIAYDSENTLRAILKEGLCSKYYDVRPDGLLTEIAPSLHIALGDGRCGLLDSEGQFSILHDDPAYALIFSKKLNTRLLELGNNHDIAYLMHIQREFNLINIPASGDNGNSILCDYQELCNFMNDFLKIDVVGLKKKLQQKGFSQELTESLIKSSVSSLFLNTYILMHFDNNFQDEPIVKLAREKGLFPLNSRDAFIRSNFKYDYIPIYPDFQYDYIKMHPNFQYDCIKNFGIRALILARKSKLDNHSIEFSIAPEYIEYIMIKNKERLRLVKPSSIPIF